MARIDYRNADPIEIRRAVIVALTDYVERYGEISDDPDDLNSVAAAIWSALGASKHDKPANDRPIYSQNQPETAGREPTDGRTASADRNV